MGNGQKPGKYPKTMKNDLGVKRAVSVLFESCGVFLKQLSEFRR